MPRDANKGRRDGVYGTKEVAEILGIPEWRVKNFSQGTAYGLPPSKIVGKGGRGSRRLYYYNDLYNMAIADELVRCGFTPEAVGRALGEITPSMWDRWADWAMEKPETSPLLLTCRRGAWTVHKLGDVRKLVTKALDRNWEGFFLLDFFSLWSGVHSAVERFENESGGGKR